MMPNDTVRAVNGADLADKSRGQRSAASYGVVSDAMAALEADRMGIMMIARADYYHKTAPDLWSGPYANARRNCADDCGRVRRQKAI